MTLAEVIVPEGREGVRLDLFLSEAFGVSRTFAQETVERGGVFVNGRTEKKRYCVAASDRISFSPQKPVLPSKIQPVKMAFDILFEDDHLFVINKPAGLVVHPAPGNYEGTFVNGFLAHCTSTEFDDPIRPGVVHRLDKETSGVLIAAKTQKALQALSAQFHDRTIHKEYMAILQGIVASPLVEEGCIGRDPKHRQRMAVLPKGRPSLTTFVPIVSSCGHTLVQALPQTGRTHQIRVHAAFLGYPVLGDALYGKNLKERGAPRHMLHCSCIRCVHPITGDTLTLQAPLPVDMLAVMRELHIYH